MRNFLYSAFIAAKNSYSQSRLLEINSHSLFSRWFSESGKLVQRLFSNIMEMVEDEDCFVVVLIGKFGVCMDHRAISYSALDEVESLTAARAGAMAGTEPSDGLRVRPQVCLMTIFHKVYKVVNALLTQLDKLRYEKNVLVMSTSNLAKAIGKELRGTIHTKYLITSRRLRLR